MSATPLTARRPHFRAEERRATRELASAVVVDCLTRRFGAKPALDGVSLEVEAGRIHALVGPNGAGKTTLLRVLTGLLDPDAGSVRVLGLDPARAPRELRRRIGVVPSGTRSFYLRISGYENLAFFARLYGHRARDARRRADEAVAAVGLSAAAHAPVATYSTGMQRRLAVARATLHDPSLLLIDEATHDLDPEASTRVRLLVQQAAERGAAVLWTTQRLEELKGFADMVTMLDSGCVRFAGTVPQLLARAERRHYLITLDMSGGEPPDHLTLHGQQVATLSQTGEVADGHYLLTLAEDAVLGDTLDVLSRRGHRVIGCSEARPSIEEAFLSLVERGPGR